MSCLIDNLEIVLVADEFPELLVAFVLNTRADRLSKACVSQIVGAQIRLDEIVLLLQSNDYVPQ